MQVSENKKSLSVLSQRSSNLMTEGRFNQNNFTEKFEEEHKHSGTLVGNCEDSNCLKEIIKEEKKKNMNLRHDIHALNKQIESLANREQEYIKTIQGLKLDKEVNNKYVLKMETMIHNLNKNKKLNEKDKESKNVSKLNEVLLTTQNKDENENIIKNLNEELEQLKNFKTQIFKISMTYDDVNMSIFNSLKEIKDLFIEFNNNLNDRNKNKLEFKGLDKITGNKIF